MIDLRFGQWAARFLAAAGVSAACSDPGSQFAPASYGGTSGVGGATGSGESTSGGVAGTEVALPNVPNHYPCDNPTPYGNPDSGLERCQNPGAGGGPPAVLLHRVRVGSCDVAAASATGCRVDEDCPPIGGFGSICSCDGSGEGTCVAATCTSDLDCDEGYACIGDLAGCLLPVVNSGTAFFGFACQGPRDTCLVEAQCAGGGCTWMVGSDVDDVPVHSCANCSVGGRPFLVASTARTASSTTSSDWLESSLDLSATALTPRLCGGLAAHWRHQAELEHASIAAFARFILELLSLGAPSALVTAATNGLADETAHARICYGLASAYAGHLLGPAQLDVTDALGDLTLTGIVTRAVLEGCVGETLAAIEVSEAANGTADPALRAVLVRIAEDEARHAELSWRFLSWALSRGEPELGASVRRAFRKAESGLTSWVRPCVATRILDAELVSHGVLPSERRVQLALDAYRFVIAPCAAALLSGRAPSASVAALAPA